MRKLNFLFFALVLSAGCNFRTSRTNMPDDNQNAVSCCKKFDDFRKSGETSSAMDMIKEQIDEEEMNGVFNKVDSLMGNLVSYEVGDVSSSVEKNNGMEVGSYAVDFKCVYEKGNATEHFALSSGNDKKIKIIGFHVNMDL
jgi:hypothetical protein